MTAPADPATTAPGRTSGYRERNSTADRALTILAMFDEDRLVLSAVEVADTLGVARSTAYRYLQSLVGTQLLSEDGRGGFRLGVKVLQLARLARRSYGLADLAVPVMQALAEEFHQTVLLTRRVGAMVVCVEREEAREQFLRLSYERGTVMGLNAGASAQVLLAQLDEAEVRELVARAPLERLTDRSITDSSAFVERLRRIRADGYAVSIGEVDPEAMGIAAPVLRPSGEVLAGLSVVLIRSRVDEPTVEHIIAGVVRAAATLTQQARHLDD